MGESGGGTVVRMGGGIPVLFASLLLSCSSDSASTTTDTPGAPDVPDVVESEPSGAAVGAFQVKLVPPGNSPGYTAVFGQVHDGPTPSPVAWEESAAEGACRLWEPRIPVCLEPCGGVAACVDDGVCQPYPAAADAGTVQVQGLMTDSGHSTFEMSPIVGTYQPTGLTLAYPAFSEGDEIVFTAAGADTPAFELRSVGIAPLELSNETFPLESGEPLVLQWTPPGQSADTRIRVHLDISHHGGTKGKVECEWDDTGSLELPAALLDQLLALGVSGFPTIVISREAVGSTSIPMGRVDLLIVSSLERAVEIEGLLSCNEDEDCPDGQSCTDDRRCE